MPVVSGFAGDFVTSEVGASEEVAPMVADSLAGGAGIHRRRLALLVLGQPRPSPQHLKHS